MGSRQAYPLRGQWSPSPLARLVQSEQPPSFYLSMSDLMCLMLVCFVVLFSSYRPRPAVCRVLVRSPVPSLVKQAEAAGPIHLLRVGLAPQDAAIAARELNAEGAPDQGLVASNWVAMVEASQGLPPEAAPKGPTLSQLLESLNNSKPEGSELTRGERELTLRLPAEITFDLGSARVKPSMARALGKVARVIRRYRECKVVVTGHTDDLPIHNEKFASNWELSAARAAAVARILMAKGVDPARVTIQGMADTHPLLPNTSEANRRRNRRVEIQLKL